MEKSAKEALLDWCREYGPFEWDSKFKDVCISCSENNPIEINATLLIGMEQSVTTRIHADSGVI